jgi:hypothetical protein
MREEALGREGIHEKKEERKETLMEHREVGQPENDVCSSNNLTACAIGSSKASMGHRAATIPAA